LSDPNSFSVAARPRRRSGSAGELRGLLFLHDRHGDLFAQRLADDDALFFRRIGLRDLSGERRHAENCGRHNFRGE
jgi:hypothetical protein